MLPPQPTLWRCSASLGSPKPSESSRLRFNSISGFVGKSEVLFNDTPEASEDLWSP